SGADPAARDAAARPSALDDAGIEQRIGERIPLDLAFRDESGESVRLGDYFGDKPVLLVPAYYRCPMLCGLVLEGVSRSLKVLAFGAATDYQLVVFSFNPEETPADAAARKERALALYGRDGGDPGWHFLTGDQEAIAQLTRAIGYRYGFDAARGEYVHAAGILALTPDGTIARYFYGVELAPKDLRLGLVEASQGRLGTVIDQALLYCYRYDPAVGRYSLLTMRLVRIGGAVTVLGLGLLIGLLLREERAGRRRMSEGTAAP
ncbi:MAG TPA: SCO family protein, partial [Thermoanaerobaculia bacterium]|nr:SCO family protein [Thermoanaerobaculia bacterium]